MFQIKGFILEPDMWQKRLNDVEILNFRPN